MGADERHFGKGLSKAADDLWTDRALARVMMTHWLTGVHKYGQMMRCCGFGQRSQERYVVQGKALAIGHQFAHSTQPSRDATFKLTKGLLRLPGIDHGEADQSSSVASCGLNSVVVSCSTEAHVGPGEAKGHCVVYPVLIQGLDECFCGGQPGLRILVERPKPRIPLAVDLPLGDDLRRGDVGVNVNDHLVRNSIR